MERLGHNPHIVLLLGQIRVYHRLYVCITDDESALLNQQDHG